MARILLDTKQPLKIYRNMPTIFNPVKNSLNPGQALRRAFLLLVPVFLLATPVGVYGDDQETDLVIGLVDKGTDVLYLPAAIGGEATELLLDTGSGYLALNSTLIDSLEDRGLAHYERSIRARLATGKTSKVKIYNIATVDLGSGCVMHNIEAARLGTHSRNILGMNVLKRVDSISLSLTTSTLTLSGCSVPDNTRMALNHSN
jgi:gag-polyprotein putative aspartyl protease